MPKEQPLYDFIYQYFKSELDLGLYKNGSYMYTIQEYCNFFDVSPLTVRLAFQRLEKEGYLSLSRGRPALVVKSGSDLPLEEPGCDRWGVADLNRTMELLKPPVFVQGLWADNEKALTQLEAISILDDLTHIQQLNELFVSLLKALGNPLYFYLHLDCMVCSQHAVSRSVQRKLRTEPDSVFYLRGQLQKLLAARRSDRPEVAMDIFRHLYQGQEAPVDGAAPDAQDEGAEPFQWRPFKGRANYSYLVADDLLHKIWLGEIHGGEPLPQVEMLAEEYGVSVKTVRQALHQLGKAGAVETRNGVGSFVCEREEWTQRIEWKDPTVQKHMASYFQAMQFTVVVVREVARHSFPRVPPQAFAAVAEKMREDPMGNLYPTSNECLRLLVEYSGLEALRAIYGELARILAWGIFYPPEGSARLEEWKAIMGQIISAIETRDTERFASQLQRLYHSYFMYDRAEAARLGIQGVQAITVPKLL